MEHIFLKARAKVNLALDIIRKREDGYHEMKMVMQTLSLYDGVFIKKIDRPIIKLVCNVCWLPVDERNLVYKAAQYLIEEYKISSGVFIDLDKMIPVSAGLAGGSSDCAATLIGMRHLFQLPVTDEEFIDLGKNFGADVPYCLTRGTVLAEGIGEKLTLLPPHPYVYVLVAKPNVRVSTKEVFSQYDSSLVMKHPDISAMITDIQASHVKGIASKFCNVLETVTVRMYPVIDDIKFLMKQSNALGALMSGSGPTVFGYFTNENRGFAALNRIRAELPEVKEIYLTKIFNPRNRLSTL